MRRVLIVCCVVVGVSGPARSEVTETLVVLNKVAGTAWLLDAATGDARAKVRVGDGPHEAATSPDGRLAVVCNYGAQSSGSTLSVIDIERGAVTRTIDLAPHGRPHGIRYLDPDHVLVTSEITRRLLKVNVTAGRVVSTHDAGGDIHMVDLSPDGRTAYATAIGAGLLCRVDLTDPDSEPTLLELGSGTEALAVRPGGSEIWVGNNDDQTVRVVAVPSFEVVAEIECGVRPIRLAFTPDGMQALVSCLLSGDLAVIDTATRSVIERVAIADFVAPLEMWLDRSEAEQQDLARRVMAEGARPIGVLVPPDGSFIYVAARGQDYIAVIDPGTWEVVRRWETGSGPDGMAWSSIQ